MKTIKTIKIDKPKAEKPVLFGDIEVGKLFTVGSKLRLRVKTHPTPKEHSNAFCFTSFTNVYFEHDIEVIRADMEDIVWWEK